MLAARHRPDRSAPAPRAASARRHARPFPAVLGNDAASAARIADERPREAVVHAPAVMHQRARPVEPQQLFGRLAAAGRIDHVTRFPPADESVQPSRRPPTRQPVSSGTTSAAHANVLPQLFIGRRATRGRAGESNGRWCPGRAQLREQRSQQFHALAVRQAQLFVHDRQQRHGRSARVDWPPRHGPSRSATSCRPCTAVTAIVAHADMHVEPAIDHRAGNLGLILTRDVRFAHVSTAAVRAVVRQRHVVGLVDPRRHAAMGVRPMSPARLATRRLRFFDRRALRERRRLPFAAATFFFQRGRELGDLVAQRANQRLQLGNPTFQFAATWAIVRASRGIHDRRDYHPPPEGASPSR